MPPADLGARRILALGGLCILGFLGAFLGYGFGPRSLVQTRLQYNEAVKTTSEEQFLLNIVRLRYTNTPSPMGPRSIGIAAVQTAIEHEYDEIRYDAFRWESVRDQAPCERRELTHAIAVSRELHPATQRFAQGSTSDDQHRPLR